MSVDELRAQISQRLRSSAAFSQTVYQEQPIIMTGSQLKSFTPDPIREARQLARGSYAQGKDVASVFYEQARLLAGYEDDFEFAGTFSQYYPTYEDMSNEQLRGYFAWRTQVRKGKVTQGSLSFAYVYLYELINLVGVADAQEGYDKLLAFGSAYRQFDKRFEKLFTSWLNDFVIYYDLDPSLLQGYAHLENDAAFDVLLDRNAHSQDELFNALCQLSSYAIRQSPFYLEHEDEVKQLVTYAYEVAATHHDQKLSTTLAAKLSGKLSKKRIWLFERAVFANPLGIQSATYTVSPHDTVFCRTGAWFRVRYASLEGTLPWVSQLLETCEHALREVYQYPNTLSQSIKTKYLTKAIDAQARAIVEEKQEREARAVHIDFGKLDHIRSAANETCEKLIVEEEEAVPVFTASAGSDASWDSSTARSSSAPLRMTEEPHHSDSPLRMTEEPPHVILSEQSESKDPAADNGDSSTSGLRPFAQNDVEGAAPMPSAQNDVKAESADEALEPRSKGASRKDREAGCRGATVEAPAPHPHDASPAEADGSTVSSLSLQEQELLIHLLQGGDARAFERTHACIASVLIDSINEKLYDEFVDICIDAGSAEPEVIEDYAGDLRALLGIE